MGRQHCNPVLAWRAAQGTGAHIVPGLQETGLVVLWMTNRSRLWQFMEADLLPAWGLHIVATWLWLKVTDDGQPVSPLVC